MVVRGPLTDDYPTPDLSTELGEADGILIGAWTFQDKLLLGFMDKSKGYLPPWKQPYLRTTEESKLLAPKKTILHVNLTTGTITKTTSEVEEKHIPCRRGARLEDFVYGHAAGPRSEMIDWNGGKIAKRPLLRWNGNSGKPTAYTNAPYASQDVKAYLNRLFCLGGAIVKEESKTGSWTKGLGIFSMVITTEKPEETTTIQVGDEISGAGIPAGSKVTLIAAPGEFWIDKEVTETKSKVAFTVIRGKRYEANTLFFSDQGGPAVDTEDVWKDNASGLVNRIVVGEEDGNDFGVAMAVVGQSMIVFKRHSVWALYGYSSSTFQVRNLTYGFGCVDPNSVVEAHSGVYFASQQGIQFFDGSSFIQMDERIANITDPISGEVAGENVDQTASEYFGQISAQDIGGDYLMVSYTKQALFESGEVTKGDLLTPSFVGMMHQPTGNWSEFTTSNFNSTGVPLYISWAASRPWCYDGDCINQMSKLTSINSQYNTDTIHAPGAAIPAKMWSDRINLSSPGYTCQLHRFLLDYRFPNGSTDAGAIDGWYVTLTQGDGTVLMAQEQVPGHATDENRGPIDGPGNSIYIHGRRWEKDVFAEAIDCRLEIEWKSSTTLINDPEIFDAVLEYATARQRRSM